MISIGNREVEINILEELEAFDWKQGKPEGNEYKACSPFRDERKPSFYVNLETGLWMDHGSDNDEWKRGNIVSLLAFMLNLSYEESESYLLEKYDTTIEDAEGLELNINIQMVEEKPKVFTREELKPYLFRMKDYLLKRGVSEEVQKEYIVGYDKESKAVAFFWLDSFTGRVVNVKFRSIRGKQFFYIKGGQKVSEHVFGLYQVIKGGHKKVYIVESEIDALYLVSNGIPAVALGGSFLSASQKKKLLQSGVETFVIATDNDKAGNRIRESLKRELAGHCELLDVTLPDYAKDINDVKQEDIKKVTDSEEPITLNVALHY